MMAPAGTCFRILATPLAVVVARVFFGLEFSGAAAIPRRGAAILVANHQGYLDPFFLQMATARPIRYLMTSDFYDVPAARPFFRLVGAIRVREAGLNRDSLRAALHTLARGGLVGIFPEGRLSRDGRLSPALPGAAFLAAKSGAPVVPARIRGSIRVLPRGRVLPRLHRVRIRFGRPFRVADARDRAAARRILEKVERL